MQPLNGTLETSRGLPLTEDNIPPEWKAHAPKRDCSSATHRCQNPDFYDVDPRTIPCLSDRHLVFWTSSAPADAFSLVDSPIQKIDQGWGLRGSPSRKALLDYDGNQVGNILFDGAGLSEFPPGVLEFIVIAEAQVSLLDTESTVGIYPYYLAMLVETHADRAIRTRVGVGQILKTAWAFAQPCLKLICLG